MIENKKKCMPDVQKQIKILKIWTLKTDLIDILYINILLIIKKRRPWVKADIDAFMSS